MAHHKKSNKEVEGNPDTGHGRGMPRRPDAEELEDLTEVDREEVGLPPDRDAKSAEQVYQDEEAELDREVGEGKVRSTPGAHRKNRESFPPSHYGS